MKHVICTGDYVWVRAGHTSRHGFVQSVSVNYLGQLVYWIDGQPYSDPEITRSLKVGDTVFVRLNAGERWPLVGRILGLSPLYGQEPWQDALAIYLEIWESGWAQMTSPVKRMNVAKSSFRENVPMERSLTTCRRVLP